MLSNESNGCQMTAQAYQMMKRVDEIADAKNWDESDSQVDYFYCNYYLDIEIGRWDKPFVVA